MSSPLKNWFYVICSLLLPWLLLGSVLAQTVVVTKPNVLDVVVTEPDKPVVVTEPNKPTVVALPNNPPASTPAPKPETFPDYIMSQRIILETVRLRVKNMGAYTASFSGYLKSNPAKSFNSGNLGGGTEKEFSTYSNGDEFSKGEELIVQINYFRNFRWEGLVVGRPITLTSNNYLNTTGIVTNANAFFNGKSFFN